MNIEDEESDIEFIEMLATESSSSYNERLYACYPKRLLHYDRYRKEYLDYTDYWFRLRNKVMDNDLGSGGWNSLRIDQLLTLESEFNRLMRHYGIVK